MKSLLKIVGLFFISVNLAFAAGNVNSTAKSKVESSKSVVGTKANDQGKGKFNRSRPARIKPDGNANNKNADKGQIFSSPAAGKVNPNKSAKK